MSALEEPLHTSELPSRFLLDYPNADAQINNDVASELFGHVYDLNHPDTHLVSGAAVTVHVGVPGESYGAIEGFELPPEESAMRGYHLFLSEFDAKQRSNEAFAIQTQLALGRDQEVRGVDLRLQTLGVVAAAHASYRLLDSNVKQAAENPGRIVSMREGLTAAAALGVSVAGLAAAKSVYRRVMIHPYNQPRLNNIAEEVSKLSLKPVISFDQSRLHPA